MTEQEFIALVNEQNRAQWPLANLKFREDKTNERRITEISRPAEEVPTAGLLQGSETGGYSLFSGATRRDNETRGDDHMAAVNMKRWAMRSLRYYAVKYKMTTRWNGPHIEGYDRRDKKWVVLMNGSCF